MEDDASRKILAMIETESPTVEASIAVIVVHGPQFYANKRDKNGHADHRFERYCREHNIELILCKYHHPQSNGKIERFFQTYARHRHAFKTKDEFLRRRRSTEKPKIQFLVIF